MVDRASGQVSHGHVGGLFRLSCRPFPLRKASPPWPIGGVSTLTALFPCDMSSDITQEHVHSGEMATAWRQCPCCWCCLHRLVLRWARMLPQLPAARNRPPSSQPNRPTTAPCGNGGTRPLRASPKPTLGKVENLMRYTVSQLPQSLASSPAPILTRR